MKTTLGSLRTLRARREQKAAIALHSARRHEAQIQEQVARARETERRIIAARDENRQIAYRVMVDAPQTGQSIQQLTANFAEFDNLVSSFTSTRHSTELRERAATQGAVAAATVWRARRRAIEAIQLLEERQAANRAELEEIYAADELDDATTALRQRNPKKHREQR